MSIHLLCSCSDYNQTKARYKGDSAENRREGEGVLGLVGDLDRAKVDVFFLVGERDSAGSKSDDAKDDEKDSDDGEWLHGSKPFRAVSKRNLRCDADCARAGCTGGRIPAGTCRQFESGVICLYTGKEDGPAYEN